MSGSHEISRPAAACAARSPLPASLGVCRVVEGFLRLDECRAIIERTEKAGFRAADEDYPPSYRDNDRLVIDDAVLASELFARLRPYAPETLEVTATEDGVETWRVCGLNERLRFCRYRAGQQFRIQQDGVHFADEGVQSRLTFMIYLSDGAAFEGGDTLFYARGPLATRDPSVVARIRPKAGMLIMFDHALFHAGAPVTSGVKHVIRSDVLYRRTGAARAAPRQPFAGHRGYVWTLERLSGDRVASGGRDATIRIWDVQGRALGAGPTRPRR